MFLLLKLTSLGISLTCTWKTSIEWFPVLLESPAAPVRYDFYFTLLSIAGKVLASLLLNRLVLSIAEEHLPESQWGFRANRSTTDMVFVLCQLQEKFREQNMGSMQLLPT